METVHFVRTDEIVEKIDRLFQSEKQKLARTLPNTQIEHVGGTSLPGSISKGDLDINIRVDQLDFGKTIEILKKLYEINQPDNWTSGFASFKNDALDLGIQLTAIGSPDDYFVAQRDYLKNHPEKVAELNELKKNFEGKDVDEYRRSKDVFFQKLLP